jgi:hypothetical protein
METGPGRAAAPRTHRLFGLTLASDFVFQTRLARGQGDADLVFSSSGRAPFAARLGEPIYRSPWRDEAGESLSCLFRLAEVELLRFGDVLDFYLGEGQIHCHLRDPTYGYLVELRLLGPVIAYLLERRSVCALHASAVVVGGGAVAFLAASRGGKTALAATLMEGGHQLLSDDLLPVGAGGQRPLASAGYPQMRMWPDQASLFAADSERLRPVHPRLAKRRVPVGEGGFGAFHSRAAPLSCVYLPERRPPGHPGTQVEITPLSLRQGIVELVRCSFTPFIVEAVGLQPARLELFGRLVQRVPLRRIVYPSGFEALPRVREAVLADLETL